MQKIFKWWVYTSSMISLHNLFIVMTKCIKKIWFLVFLIGLISSFLSVVILLELFFFGQIYFWFIQALQLKWHIFIFHGQNWFKTLNIQLLLTLKSVILFAKKNDQFALLLVSKSFSPNLGCKFIAFLFLARNEKFYAISREKREKMRKISPSVRLYFRN